ncbi:MAG: hypothetical protein B6D65_05255 [candidate division Zixibacteria bacterium 4484_93]|nr:MAG: hypothetical protein B6D65_05255 [candidate division Zixibacteria bacterium 4484_93]
MKAYLKNTDGLTFIAKGESNHYLVLDTNPAVGGSDAASQPMELMLISLGGCTGMDVVSILKKKRVDFDSLEINVDAERATEHPKVFTKIDVEFVVRGDNIPAEAVERSIFLSATKYCPASAMLRKTAKIEYRYKILDKDGKEITSKLLDLGL